MQDSLFSYKSTFCPDDKPLSTIPKLHMAMVSILHSMPSYTTLLAVPRVRFPTPYFGDITMYMSSYSSVITVKPVEVLAYI